MKKITVFITIIGFVLVIFQVSLAEKKAVMYKPVWKKNCRLACHDGNTNGSPVLSPSSKTQNQWKNVYKSGYSYILKHHPGVDFSHLNEDDWEKIALFCISYAQDSFHPEDCTGDDDLVR